jgi:hypothetical protein
VRPCVALPPTKKALPLFAAYRLAYYLEVLFPAPEYSILYSVKCCGEQGRSGIVYGTSCSVSRGPYEVHRFRTLHGCQAEGPVLWRREVLHVLEISADQLKSLLAPSKEQSAMAGMVSTIFPLPLELQLTFVERYVGGYDRGRSTNHLPLPYPSSYK